MIKFAVMIILMGILMGLILVGCDHPSQSPQGLVADLIKHTRSDDPTDSFLSFSLLSDIALEDFVQNILTADYQAEKDPVKKYYYEYVLAKRMQEFQYKQAFISSSFDHIVLLLTNSTQRISIAHPFIPLLATYANTDDQALKVMLHLATLADGANATTISAHLKRYYDFNAQRVMAGAKALNIDAELLKALLLEE